MKNIHIGSLIKEQFKEKMKTNKHFNKTVFAEQIHVHRATVYLIFEQKSIDIDLLRRIGKVLDYDFIKEVYLEKEQDEKQDENESETTIEVELTKLQLQQLELSDNLHILLKVNKK